MSSLKGKHLILRSDSPEATQNIGASLGALAQPGDIILLLGELGSGKTCLTQGIARGLGITEIVNSPTFILVNEYRGRLPLYHIDLYRVEQVEEVAELGLDEYLLGGGLSVVEWAERGEGVLPEEHLLIKLRVLGEQSRELCFVAFGERYHRYPVSLVVPKEGARVSA